MRRKNPSLPEAAGGGAARFGGGATFRESMARVVELMECRALMTEKQLKSAAARRRRPCRLEKNPGATHQFTAAQRTSKPPHASRHVARTETVRTFSSLSRARPVRLKLRSSVFAAVYSAFRVTAARAMQYAWQPGAWLICFR
jgi:hypothetical protein